jgi:hypothetical protein
MKIKANKMKKIFFSKSYYNVKSICPQNKRFGIIYMNQKWGSCEKSLQRLKGIISFNFPRKRLILPNQPNRRGHY